MSQKDVLIVGAGPSGLVLALFLAKAGVTPRIIDKNSGPGLASRAMAVQARTLEFYRQLGFADEVVGKGIEIESIHFRAHGKVVGEVEIKDFGEGISPYPYILSFPQDDHERLLVEHLKAADIDVEWGTELVSFNDTGEEVQAVLRKSDGAMDEFNAAYICGCDGARSAVRQSLQLGFSGGTYEKQFYVADVEATGEASTGDAFSICLGESDFLIVLPVRSTGMNRLIGVIPTEIAGKDDVTFEDIRAHAEQAADIKVQKVNWFSTYKVHHRVAEHFRVGRAFLSGDAGHIHSPVGGQGMNTGIGDAVNLAWKLAATVLGNADPSILDTYEPERIAFAHSLVSTTDKVFQAVSGTGRGNQFLRETVFPHLMPFALGFSGTRSAAFKLVSQTRISYHNSDLSVGSVGDLHAGDRLPWVRLDDGSDNFTPLQSVDWQAHIYGTAGEDLRDTAAQSKLPLHEFEWNNGMEQAGLKRSALYLIRPDGYIALADDAQDVEQLQAYISKFKITPRIAIAAS